jgi:hypothetical protein
VLPWLRDAVRRFAALPGISEADARKVIIGNAADVFGIDVGSNSNRRVRGG